MIELLLGSLALIALGYLLHILQLELAQLMMERAEDRAQVLDVAGDANSTGWDRLRIAHPLPIKMPIAKHRAPDSGARLYVHTPNGTHEFPFIPTQFPGVSMTRRGLQAKEERRWPRERLGVDSGKPGNDVAEVPGTQEVQLRDKKDSPVRRQTVQRPSYAGIPMSDWT